MTTIPNDPFTPAERLAREARMEDQVRAILRSAHRELEAPPPRTVRPGPSAGARGGIPPGYAALNAGRACSYAGRHLITWKDGAPSCAHCSLHLEKRP